MSRPEQEPAHASAYRGLDDDEDHAALRQHYEAFFDREGEELTAQSSPFSHRMGAFRVLEVAPNDISPLWTYATIGAFALRTPAVEFALAVGERSARAVELLTIAAAHHQTRGLGPGDRLPLGEPWLDGATCDAFLVSDKHPLGTTFERARAGAAAVRVLWLLPITPAERRYAAEHGTRELEQRFDDTPIEYWRRDRPSVV
jgi:hypothetical protein